ncbi:MAG: ribonuclease H [Actinomycetes bacterium]
MSAGRPSDATVVYTDGACSGNPGPGGWAWAEPNGAWASGADPGTTNQRMEITAAAEAVRAHEGPVHVVSDSTYVVNCFNDGWWRGWISRGWKNSKREPVANRDLWEPFVELVEARRVAGAPVNFEWVKGHGGDPFNDVVDRLAVRASQTGAGASGSSPPTESELGPADTAASSAVAAAPTVGTRPDAAARIARDKRIPVGWTLAVIGLRSETLAASDVGLRARQRLAEILRAQAQMHPDLVVLTGLRPGAEEIAAAAALAAEVPYVVVLPYPDPAAKWPADQRAAFDQACAAAANTVVLEKGRPTDAEGRRAAMARRDGWLRGASCAAVVLSDGTDPDAERLVRRFEELLGDEVWYLEVV